MPLLLRRSGPGGRIPDGNYFRCGVDMASDGHYI